MIIWKAMGLKYNTTKFILPLTYLMSTKMSQKFFLIMLWGTRMHLLTKQILLWPGLLINGSVLLFSCYNSAIKAFNLL